MRSLRKKYKKISVHNLCTSEIRENARRVKFDRARFFFPSSRTSCEPKSGRGPSRPQGPQNPKEVLQASPLWTFSITFFTLHNLCTFFMSRKFCVRFIEK